MAPGNNRLLSLMAAVGSVVLLAVVIFMLWPADPSDTMTVDRDQPEGETIGWVSKVEANTIHVNSGPFGGGVVPLLVTRNTRITIGSKEGWFEDIRPGGQVKVVYQVAHGKRLARTVEVLVDEGPRRPAHAEPRVKSTAGGAASEQGPAKPALASSSPGAEPRVVEHSRSKPSAVVPPPAAAPTKPAAPSLSEGRPAPRPEPARAQAVEPSPRPAATNGRGSAPAEPGGRAPDAARPSQPAAPATPAVPAATRPAESSATESEGTDGAAAVDWLLKGRR